MTDLAISGSELYVGGQFSSIGGQPRERCAAFDLASPVELTAWGPNAGGDVIALAVDGASVFVGGSFSSIGGQTRHGLAALDLTSGAAIPWNPASPGTVIHDIEADSVFVFVAGNFSSIGGLQRSHVAMIYSPALFPDSAHVYGLDFKANAPVDDIELDGATLFLGGHFTSIWGQPRNYLASFYIPLGHPTSWNPNPNGVVHDLALSGDGASIYVSGGFTTVNGVSRQYLAEVNTTAGGVTAWDPAPDNFVWDLALSGSTIYVGGEFLNIGGQTRSRLAAVDATTGAATAWRADVEGSSEFPGVYTLCLDGSTLFAGGEFMHVSNQPRYGLCALDAISGALTSWNPNPVPEFVGATTLGDGILYIGGGFKKIGGEVRAHLAGFYTGGQSSVGPHPPSGLTLKSLSNPVRGAARLQFELATAGPVRIDIFDVAGRLVSRLIDQKRMSAGLHEVAFDAASVAPSTMPMARHPTALMAIVSHRKPPPVALASTSPTE